MYQHPSEGLALPMPMEYHDGVVTQEPSWAPFAMTVVGATSADTPTPTTVTRESALSALLRSFVPLAAFLLLLANSEATTHVLVLAFQITR
ncbi:MAG: hypothetical protein ABT17_07245 [Rhodanobacter sp. SCN 69-32]|nr:MAG: hypothetical protein ABT17_07245 [Rhodanobacter sp. SCN 69-32]